MDLVIKLEAHVAELRKNAEAFYNKGNGAAGTRARKNALDIKNLASEIRKNVSETKNTGK